MKVVQSIDGNEQTGEASKTKSQVSIQLRRAAAQRTKERTLCFDPDHHSTVATVTSGVIPPVPFLKEAKTSMDDPCSVSNDSHAHGRRRRSQRQPLIHSSSNDSKGRHKSLF